MPFNTEIFDLGLARIRDNVDKITFCSQLPTTYTEALTTYALAEKDNPTITAIETDGAGGRQVRVTTFADGVLLGDGTVTHYAVLDTVNQKLEVAGALDEGVEVNDNSQNNRFRLTQDLIIRIEQPEGV
jgi:hypothetical protein